MNKTTLTFPLLLLGLLAVAAILQAARQAPRAFHVWAVSCSHVPADIQRGRESLAKAIRQSEGLVPGVAGFDWDIMIDAGDLSAHQFPPGDADGMELHRQYRALTNHRREQIYNVQGNHDAPYYDHGPGSWFRKWGDPLGEFTEFSGVDPARRPFPVEGTWERYRFVAGNILFLMLADRNDAPAPVGRGHSREKKRGGYPPGAVTRETFEWWREQVLANQDKIIITMHHHALRDTTVASGNGEGNPRYHGSTGGAPGSSYLYFLIENDDPADFRFTPDAHVFEDFLDDFYRKNGRGAIDCWVAGHTHVRGPDDDFGGKTITETRWGVHFLQVAALTRFHAGEHPLSRVLTFRHGESTATIRTWLHEPSYRDAPVGFYEPAKKSLRLRHPCQVPPPIEAMTPFPKDARVFDQPYRRSGSAATFASGESRDLLAGWDPESGELHLEDQVKNLSGTMLPELIDPAGEEPACLSFDGKRRVSIGRLAMANWDALTVAAWIRTTRHDPNMRIVSKDAIGTPGNFVLLAKAAKTWEFRVWDSARSRWSSATWEGDLGDGTWHHLCGIADGKRDRVLLYVDGELRAQSEWKAATLDDADETVLAAGADSGKNRFGHTFTGQLRDLRILPRAWSQKEIRALLE